LLLKGLSGEIEPLVRKHGWLENGRGMNFLWNFGWDFPVMFGCRSGKETPGEWKFPGNERKGI